MFRDVPGCSGMFRHVPECSVFRVLSTAPLASRFSWETANRKPQNVTWSRPCGHVCNLQFTFEPQEGLPAVSDLRQGFFATKICTASRLKVWTSFLYPFAMCLLDFWSRINELLQSFGRLKWCTSTWWKQHGGHKQWMRSSNQFYIPFCRTNIRKFSVPVQSFHFNS